MKYMLLIYQAPDYDPVALSQEEYRAVAERYAAINATPSVTPGHPLGRVEDAITVRMKDGHAAASPGPSVTKAGGSIGGYLEVEAENDEEAIRIAAMIPAVAQGGSVEIRPSKVYW